MLGSKDFGLRAAAPRQPVSRARRVDVTIDHDTTLRDARPAGSLRSAARRILIIDDESALRTTFAAVAERAGLAPLTAATYASFKKQLDRSIDAVVVDLMMPDVDGLEVIRYLAKIRCRAGIILTSGYDARVLRSAERLAVTRGLRVVGTLKKPFRLTAAIELFQSAVSRPVARGAKVDLGLTAADVQKAISHEELTLHYQPKLDLRAGKLVGVEALVRWQHPQRGLLSPGAFVPLAENSGLIHELTHWVINAAFRQGVAWKAEGLALQMAVNCSMHDLQTLSFVDDVEAASQKTGWRLADTVFEVTETAVASDNAAPLEVLTRLAMRGAELAIDDFGTGYATLDQLDRAPFSELKIDHGFVRRVESDEKTRIIVESSLVMAHRLGLRVVAEGVESQRLLKWVRGRSCDIAQGFFVGRPMPARELAEWATRPQLARLGLSC